MILPSKHLSQNRALLTIGADILKHLSSPVTVSAIWEKVSCFSRDQNTSSSLRYDYFVLALDLLYLIGAVELREGLLVRRSS
jgi:hypothetical protein